ncbi:hypothetical protein ABHN11_13410 [Brevibacillus centrosporus]|jgi:hypothetical protein|uniref:hypothetical protein n=1 Tax=Brevibacillus centrosporus TaxID=54910 RepID=UPI003987D313
MNGPNSWEVETYHEGKWRISVRHNLENDRLDEGDYPEPSSAFSGYGKTYQVFMDNRQVAEWKGEKPLSRKVMPSVSLSSFDEEQLHQFLDRQPLK